MSVVYEDPRELLEEQQQGFGQTFFIVGLAHAALIVLLLVWSTLTPPPEPPVKFLTILNMGDIVRGEVGDSAFSAVSTGTTPPAPNSPPLAPTPEPVTESTISESVGPGEWGIDQIPKRKRPEPLAPKPVVPPPDPKPKPAPKAKPRPRPDVKVNLDEVVREVEKPPKPQPAPAPQPNPQPKPDIARKLEASLKTAGVTEAIQIGRTGDSGGNPNKNSWYYGLIRDQMHSAWIKPPDLIGKKLSTEIQIAVAPDGTITNVKVRRSSGNAMYDKSAVAAARKVGRIRKPRPEGVPEWIDVTFKDQR